MSEDQMRAKRGRHSMPADIEEAIEASSLRAQFEARPHFQQNDYIGWICRAKRRDTRDKRLRQMLEELAQGGVYMKMKHGPSAKGQGALPDEGGGPTHFSK